MKRVAFLVLAFLLTGGVSPLELSRAQGFLAMCQGLGQVSTDAYERKNERKEQALKAADVERQRRAEQGGPDAQFHLGAYYLRTDRVDDAWEWFCLAANQGHARAQLALGRKFHRGSAPVAQDYVQSYVWYSLAASNGIRYAAKERDNLAETMTSAQIAEAEKLAKEWRPGSCKFKSAEVSG